MSGLSFSGTDLQLRAGTRRNQRQESEIKDKNPKSRTRIRNQRQETKIKDKKPHFLRHYYLYQDCGFRGFDFGIARQHRKGRTASNGQRTTELETQLETLNPRPNMACKDGTNFRFSGSPSRNLLVCRVKSLCFRGIAAVKELFQASPYASPRRCPVCSA
eukprot:3778958-Rhodomonas_salina.2